MGTEGFFLMSGVLIGSMVTVTFSPANFELRSCQGGR